MGLNVSNLWNEVSEVMETPQVVKEGKKGKLKRIRELSAMDPRSPGRGEIDRTPIQVAKEALEDKENGTIDTTTPSDTAQSTPLTSKTNAGAVTVLPFDPRSPTIGIERSPIVVAGPDGT